MTISFCNRGQLDLATITTMGVSVKRSTSPIGFFGTGLKFAIATLLRTGHSIEVIVDGESHTVSAEPTTIRGESFDVVCLDGRQLGYTTQLGRNWEPWQAYRELSSNARDEGEWIVTDRDVEDDDWDTIIRVTGDGIEAAHRDRDEIFCASRVVFSLPGVAEIREGGTTSVFYRGVRVHRLQRPAQYTWNILQATELTEDRTMRYPWMLESIMGRTLAMCESMDVVSSAIMAPDGSPEARADYSSTHEASPAFLEAARLHAASVGSSPSARRLWEALAPSEDLYHPVDLDEDELAMVDEAMSLCEVIDPDFESDPMFVADLGVGVLGLVREGRVYIARGCLTMGTDMLAGTLYEEYLHLHRGHTDESRSMQNHLINQLVRMARRQ